MTVPEVVSGLPTMVGFEPSEVVIAVGLGADRLPLMALVVDRDRLLDPARGAQMAASVADGFVEEGATVAVLVSYTADDIRDGCPALEALRWELEFAVESVKLLAVQNGRWFWPGCHDECCPADGTALPPVPELLPRAIPTWGGRAQGCAAPHAEARLAGARRWTLALVDGTVGDAATARVLAADLDDVCVRDFVVLTLLGADAEASMDALLGMDSGAVAGALDGALGGCEPPDPLETERFRGVVQRVARAARGKRRKAATLTLLAVLDWWEGELRSAVENCDAALASTGGYRLAELVRLAAVRGIAPGWVAAPQKRSQSPH